MRRHEPQLLCPCKERPHRSLPLLVAARTFQAMQHLVAVVDAGPAFVLAHQRDRVGDRADNAAVDQSDLWFDPEFARTRRVAHRAAPAGCVFNTRSPWSSRCRSTDWPTALSDWCRRLDWCRS